MKHHLKDVPREFSPLTGIDLKDMGEIELENNEQITFRIESGKTNDVVRKDWGFYLSNSLNSNLTRQGFKTALVVSFASTPPRLYINLVEIEKMPVFNKYLDSVNAKVVTWLDEWFSPDGKS